MFDLSEIEKNILLIDDKSNVRKLLVEFLISKFNCEEADSIECAFERIRAKEFAVVLLGLPITNEACEEIISRIKIISPYTITILISEQDSVEAAVKAFQAGVFDFILKPFQLKVIEKSVKKAFEKFKEKHLNNRYQLYLEELVAERANHFEKALEEMEMAYRMTLKALVQAMETRDFETYGHAERVITFSLRLGHELSLDKKALKNLELGALLHDIGKIGVPDAILRKPAALTAEEWNKMKLHPQHGQNILRNIAFVEGAVKVVAQHHEKWDGSGYPNGLRGEEIDLCARVFAVIDAFEAMISDRIYRRGRPYRDALKELEKCAGIHFDPLVVEAFKNIPPEDWELLRERSLTDKQEIYSFQAVVAELIYSRQHFDLIH